MTLTTIITVLSPPVYRSDAKILVRIGRASVAIDPTVATGPIVPVAEPREKELNSILAMLESRWIRESVVRKLGASRILETDRPGDPDVKSLRSVVSSWLDGPSDRPQVSAETVELERAVRVLDESLSASVANRSNVIALSADAGDPQLAHDIVQTVIEVYVEGHARSNRALGSHDFFQSQTEQLAEQLQSKQEQLRQFKSTAAVGDLDLSRRLLMERIGDRQTDLWQAEADAVAVEAKISAALQRLQGLPEMEVKEETTGHQNLAADEMRNQLYTLQLEHADLLAKHSESHPLVQQVRRQIDEAKAILAQEDGSRTQVTRGLSRIREELQLNLLLDEVRLAEAKAAQQAIQEQLAAGQRGIDDLGKYEVQLTQMQRELDQLDGTYRRYADSLEQTRIEEALEASRISNLNVVEPPTMVFRPIRPRKLWNLVAGLLASLTAALAITVYRQPHRNDDPEPLPEILMGSAGTQPEFRGRVAEAPAPVLLRGRGQV